MHFQLGDVFYKYFRKTIETNKDTKKCIDGIKLLLDGLVGEVTKDENISFSTSYSRYAFALFKFQFSKQLRFFIHNLRFRIRRKDFSEETLALGKRVLAESIAQVTGVAIPTDIKEALVPFPVQSNPLIEPKEYFKELRVYVISDHKEDEYLLVETEIYGNQVFRVPYNMAGLNETFTKTVQLLRAHYDFPATLNLIDVKLMPDNTLHAAMFVLEPDSLIGVTYVSGCFKNREVEPRLDILNKFSQRSSNKYLLIGNIANFFLDELIFDSNQTFQELFPKVFNLAPLEFALLTNAEIRQIMEESKSHFVTIKKMIEQDLNKNNIYKEDCYLEPSFYSPKYGFQGRLDLLYAPNIAEKSAIIELKSGKVYDANRYGLNQDHYIQTLCYDMVIERSIGVKTEIGKYIFYSKYYDNPLRHAPSIKYEKMSALQLRNELIAQEHILAKTFPDNLYGKSLLESLSPLTLKLTGFVQHDVRQFEMVYKNLTDVEKTYFLSFIGFIAREQHFSKVGNTYSNGGAALWLESIEEKEANYAIINYLTIGDISNIHAASASVILLKSDLTNRLANFRIGDRVVLYPNIENKTAVQLQLYKGTLVELTEYEVVIKLASRQLNDKFFKAHQYWNIERDSLDSSFNRLYEALFQWAMLKSERRALLLGQRFPASASEQPARTFVGTTDEQASILNKILDSRDYFLLWGPPGTGKTSVMVRHLVEYHMCHTDEKILLLAYTNRAVDELCAAIESVQVEGIKDMYFRIGSRYAVDPVYRNQLLGAKIEGVKRRDTLKELISQHRIVVATLSSFQSQRELLKLIHFDRVIVDEASQIIEPMIIGFLGMFKHFTLIGDHQQLPAVVAQPISQTKVKNSQLEALGIADLRNSYFERLFNSLKKAEQTDNFAMLSMQGRMHQEIMAFPGKYFYENKLQILPDSLGNRQSRPFKHLSVTNARLEKILSRRVSFVHVPSGVYEASKTNEAEATLIANIIEELAQQGNFDFSNIGIITPFRAQIAKIKSELEEKKLYSPSLMIDTVERYQGGAKDLIIISLCITHPLQLRNLVSSSSNGIDRKLNVALTRAREQLILLGNVTIFEDNTFYKSFIEEYIVTI